MGGIYWIASYPKSGNTWFRTLLQNLAQNEDTPANINQLSIGMVAGVRTLLDETLGFATADLTQNEIDRLRPHVYDWLGKCGATGYLKIHDACHHDENGEPMIGRHGTLGAVYLVRNPLDIVPSYANHLGKTIDQTIEVMADPHHALNQSTRLMTGQVRQMVSTWSNHARSWTSTNWLNVHVIRYEDLLADTAGVLTDALAFMGRTEPVERIEKAVAFSSFAELQRQESEAGFFEKSFVTKTFFRSGTAGGWRDELTPHQVARIISTHGAVMKQFGYLDHDRAPV